MNQDRAGTSSHTRLKRTTRTGALLFPAIHKSCVPPAVGQTLAGGSHLLTGFHPCARKKAQG